MSDFNASSVAVYRCTLTHGWHWSVASNDAGMVFGSAPTEGEAWEAARQILNEQRAIRQPRGVG